MCVGGEGKDSRMSGTGVCFDFDGVRVVVVAADVVAVAVAVMVVVGSVCSASASASIVIVICVAGSVPPAKAKSLRRQCGLSARAQKWSDRTYQVLMSPFFAARLSRSM